MLVRICAAVALAWWLVPRPVAADAPAPAPAQLERAKQAFAEGKQLHDAGKLGEAIEKFKLSYELSRNPLLLYNIGLTMEELGSDDLAVVYYRKFLAEAAPDAAQRADATARIAAIARKLALPEPPAPAEPAAPGSPAASAPAQPAGLEHRPIEAAPPGQPLDVTAIVPEGSALLVTLLFRTAGQATFTSTPMLPHGRELVGRVPASRMTGSALQYYLEARDPAGTLIARAGRSTSPNVVNIDAAAPPRFFADVAEPVLTQVVAPGDGEDPLARAGSGAAPGSGDGILDVGSPRFRHAKWGTTALAGASIGAGVVLNVLARAHAKALVDDAAGCGAPPCQKFDDFDRDIERVGKREQTISNVALFGGIAVAAVAGYLWIRELTAERGDPRAVRTARSRSTRKVPATSWQVVPSLGSGLGTHGEGFTGAAAAVRF
jgi:hypothetical protein